MYELNHKLWKTFYGESVLSVPNDWIINGILECFLCILGIACNYWYLGVQFSAIQLANLSLAYQNFIIFLNTMWFIYKLEQINNDHFQKLKKDTNSTKYIAF